MIPQSKLGPLSEAIINVVAGHPGISTEAIQEIIAESHPKLGWHKAACSNLAQKNYIVNAEKGQKLKAVWYTPKAWETVLATRPAPESPEEKTQRNWLAMPTGRRPISKEPLVLLQSQPVREGAMQAFGADCLSRTGDKYSAYSGPKPMCVGPGQGIYGPGRAGSAARGVV